MPLTYILTIAQNVILLYLTYDLLRSKDEVARVIVVTALSYALLAALHLSGAAVKADGMLIGRNGNGMVGRESALGSDYNYYAYNMCIGLVCALWLLDRASSGGRRINTIAWGIAAGLIVLAIVKAGSRGAFVASMPVVLTSAFAKRKVVSILTRLAVLAALFITIFLVLPEDSVRTLKERCDMTLASGQLSGREDIFPVAWAMFLERPLFGWGPFISLSELGARVGAEDADYRDTHNLGLRVLTEAGVIGAIPFILGFFLCYLSAWLARKGPFGFVALGMMNVTFIVNASLTCYLTKSFWFSLGLVLACDSFRVPHDDRSLHSSPHSPLLRFTGEI